MVDQEGARRFARLDIEHKEAHPLARFRCQRLFHHAVVRPVEYCVGRLRGVETLIVEYIERRAIDVAPIGIGLCVKLALHDQILAVDLGRIALTRLHQQGTVLPEVMCSRIIGVPQ